MKVSPTGKWMSDLVIPDVGIIRKPLGDSILVAPSAGDWLLEQGYAVPTQEDTQSPTQSKPKAQPTLEPEPEEVVQAQDQEDSGWTAEAIAFLEASPVEEIATSINGVGPATAAEIKGLNPITWEGVEAILSQRQRNSLKDIFNG